MAKRALVKFRRTLKKLWIRKSARLLNAVERTEETNGKKLSKRHREKELAHLMELTEQLLLPKAIRHVSKTTDRRSVFFRRGTRRKTKWNVLRKRMGRGRQRKHLVYTLWDAHGNCLKVGRSDGGIGRLGGQKDSYYFWFARRVTFFFPKRRKKGSLPALECVLTHRYQPRKFHVMPARRKFRQKCSICQLQRFVKKEVRRLFPAG